MVGTISWLLDTNILSEAMRPSPDGTVMANLARYDGELAIPALVMARASLWLVTHA